MEERIKQLEEAVRRLQQQRVSQAQIGNLQVHQRHIKGDILFHGDIADRPSDGSTQIKFYYAEDEKKLYVWNATNSAWESVTLS